MNSCIVNSSLSNWAETNPCLMDYLFQSLSKFKSSLKYKVVMCISLDGTFILIALGKPIVNISRLMYIVVILLFVAKFKED